MRATFAVVAALGLATPALAAPADGVQQLAAMKGRCSRAILAGKDESRACLPLLANAVHTSGRIDFAFTMGKVAIVGFSGMGPQQVKLTADKVSQPIDRINLTLIGMNSPTKSQAAVGACVYENPYAGVSHVTCTAEAPSGHFEVRFTSNGQAPDVKDF